MKISSLSRLSQPIQWLGISACLGLVVGLMLGHTDDGNYSDSGIDGPPYREIVAEMERLTQAHPAWSEMVVYGQSVRGVDLTLVRMAHPNPGGDQNMAVLISGGIHGNEYLNIADRIPGHFLAHRDSMDGLRKYLDAGGVVYIIPIMNPDGYDRDLRHNLNDVDLNRDWDLIPINDERFSQPETKDLVEYIDKDLRLSSLNLKVTVDYHCCDGSLLHPWSYTFRRLSRTDLNAHRAIGSLMQHHINRRYAYGPTGRILGYYPRGTSKDYYYAKYRALAFTFEGVYRTENQNFDRHMTWWNAIFNGLVDRTIGL